jgi:hypothetical protein
LTKLGVNGDHAVVAPESLSSAVLCFMTGRMAKVGWNFRADPVVA